MPALDPDDERSRLESIAGDSWYARGANGASVRYCASLFARHWRGTRCLELGPAEGLLTEQLAARFRSLTLVDGSERFCMELRRRFPGAHVVTSLFEEFCPEGTFDTIVLGHVLEHVADPVSLLTSVRSWLAPSGLACIAVPNSRSLHRQAAVLMGLLTDEHELNDTDRHHGHRRVYDPDGLRADIQTAGLSVLEFGGYWLKPLSNAQLERDWDDQMLAAYMRMGERYPDIAGEIYAIVAT